MYLTVGEVLALPPLRELTLVAGRSGLDRQVTRVSVLEVPLGYRRWSRGGELFMSSLYALRDDGPETYANTIKLIAEGQAAALCLHPGVTGLRFLDTMIQESDRYGVPLIIIPEDMPYCVVTDAVVGGILGQQSALLERSAAVNRELTQIILNGGGLDGICGSVARRMHRSVAVLGSGTSDILAQSENITSAQRSLLGLFESHLSNDQTTTVRIPPSPATGKGRRVFVDHTSTAAGQLSMLAAPIVVDDVTAAYLVIFGQTESYSELDLMTVAHACTAVGLEVLKRRAVIEAEHRVQQDFYGAALTGDFQTLDDVTRHARHARINVAARYLVGVIERQQPEDDRWLRTLNDWRDSAVVTVDDLVAVVFPITTDESTSFDAAAHVLQRLVDQPGARHLARRMAGLSRVVETILDLPQALAQAKLALRVATALGQTDNPAMFDRLGVLQLLAGTRESADLQSFVIHALHPLLEARNPTELIRTTEAYLDAGGGFLAAAKSVGVHPNTVKYRMEKIREILGDQAFDDPARRLGLHVALKAIPLISRDGCLDQLRPDASPATNLDNLSSQDK